MKFSNSNLLCKSTLQANPQPAVMHLGTGINLPLSPFSLQSFSIAIALVVLRKVMTTFCSFLLIAGLLLFYCKLSDCSYGDINFFFGIKMRKAKAYRPLLFRSKRLMQQRSTMPPGPGIDAIFFC